MARIDSVHLETPRLTLRPLSAGDLDALAPYYADREVMRFIGSGRTLAGDEVAVALDRMIERHARDGFGQLAVVRTSDGRVLGRVGFLVWDTTTWTPSALADSPAEHEIELGWKLGREHWGRGYATEAASAMRDYGFAELGFTRLISLIDPGNRASIRVAEKLGMKSERRVDLEERPVLVYALAAAGVAPAR